MYSRQARSTAMVVSQVLWLGCIANRMGAKYGIRCRAMLRHRARRSSCSDVKVVMQ